MDILFSSSHKEYLHKLQQKSHQQTQELLAFGQPHSAVAPQSDASDSEDEDEGGAVRDVASLGFNLALAGISDVRPVLEFLKCSICQDTACDPRVIKHCLHFFCKECIEPYLLRL